MSSTVLNQSINSRVNLRILKSDIGYHFEVIQDRYLLVGLYFLYGEKVHKAAYCVGGAVYGLNHDDELAEDIMKAIEDHKDVLGGNELSR